MPGGGSGLASMPHLPRLPALLATVLLGAGCASSGSGSTGSACTSDLARHERSLDEVLDSAALVRGLAGLWGPGDGLTVASIVFDSAGGPDTTAVVSSASEVERNALAREIQRHARPGAAAGDQVDLFLGNGRGLAPRRVPELQRCPPEMRNRDMVARMLVQEAETLDILATTTVHLLAMVREDGTVDEVRIERSSSNFEVDAAAVGIMRRTMFESARVEGIPIRVWVSFPVTFQLSRRRQR